LSIDGFELDIDKLERAASTRNKNIACRIRRPKKFEKHTYFHLRADFVDGTKWDIIVPHPGGFDKSTAMSPPAQSPRRRSRSNGILRPIRRLPKVQNIRLTPENDAGVAYVFIDAVDGINLQNLR